MKYYKVYRHSKEIREIDGDRETTRFLWIGDDRIFIETEHYRIFDSEEKAKNYAISLCLKRIKWLNGEIEKEQSTLKTL